MEKKFTISVLLTKQEDFISKIIYYITGRGFTHISIGFDEKAEEFFSFTKEGFCKEFPRKVKHKITQSLCFQLEVTKEQYEKVVSLIHEFQEKGKKLKYSTLGVILCAFRIPFKRPCHYFCSEFVAEVLKKAKLADIRESVSLYFPNHLETILRSCASLKTIVRNPI